MRRLSPSLLTSTRSTRSIRSIVLTSAISLLLISPQARADEEVVDLARGATLYSQNCGRCHNARGASEFSDVYWPLIITHMRVIAGLPGEQARSIEAFLRASNNPSPRRVARLESTTDVSGDELIKTYGCQGCHRVGGAGGSIGPDLGGLFKRQSDEWIQVQIQEPRKHNAKTVMPQFGLSDAQVSAIVKALRAADSN